MLANICRAKHTNTIQCCLPGPPVVLDRACDIAGIDIGTATNDLIRFTIEKIYEQRHICMINQAFCSFSFESEEDSLTDLT